MPHLNRTDRTHKTYKTYRMKEKINAYFAVLLVTIAGSGAAMLIVRVAFNNTPVFLYGSAAPYAPLEQSILNP